MKVLVLTFILIVLAGCNSKSTTPGDFGIIPAEAPPTSNIAPLRSSPSIYNFGSVNLNQTKDATLTIINDGILPASVGSVTVSGAGYSIISNGCTSISSGGTCAVTVRYNPTTLGSGNSALKLAYDYQSVSYELEVSLIGYSVSPTAPLTASPSLYNFGTITTGQTSTKTFVVTNSGSTTATISGVSISDAIYTVTANTCGPSIFAGASCNLTVTFAPTTSGVYVGLLEVAYSSNSINYSLGINISGFGQIPAAPLRASTSLYNFGSVNVGSSSSGAITFTNMGATALTINTTALETGVIYTFIGNTCTGIIASGATCTVTVDFSPLTTTNLTDVLNINYTANAQNYDLSLNIFGLGAVTQHYLRIARQSNDSIVTDAALVQTQTLPVKAVIVDPTGAIVQTVAVSWFISSSNYTTAYLTTTTGSMTSLNASLIGTAVLQATLSDSTLIDTYNIQTPTVTTGTITVTASAVADQIVRVSGSPQTSTVGTDVPLPLRVRVLNASGIPVQNQSVTFLGTTSGTTVSPDGAVYTSSYVAYTDVNGYAEVRGRLGTTSGTNNNSWSASITSGSVTSVSFTASADFGAPASLSFSTQPSGGNSGSPLLTQPVVRVRDAFGNLVTNANNTITLTVGNGIGTLTGTTVVAAVNGIATFGNVTYSTTENGVTIVASTPIPSAAPATITSAPFDVAQILIHAQCIREDLGWVTRDGGCLDQTSGVVWSAVSATTMTWHQIVWDSVATGRVPDSFDEGRIKDVSGTAFSDSNYAGYCHDLVQSGYEDWVTPTGTLISNAATNGYVANIKKVDVNGVDRSANYFWSATVLATNQGFLVGSLGATNTALTIAYYARCVRFPAATQLAINTQPGAVSTSAIADPANPTVSSITVESNTSGQPFTRAAVVHVRTSINATRQIASNVVTATLSSGTGTLSGTTSVAAVGGVATFSNLIYTITNPALLSETIQITFSSGAGPTLLTPVTTSNITVYRYDPRNQCKLENVIWKTKNGGCKNLATGVILSQYRGGYTWYEAIWEAYLGNSTPDVNDNGATWDYDNYYGRPTVNPDTSGTNLCHDIVDSGYSDWTMPTYHNFLSTFQGSNYGFYLKHPGSAVVWTSLNYPANEAVAYGITLNADNTTVSTTTSFAKSNTGIFTFCVRRDPPTKLMLDTPPANPATSGLPAGMPWSTPITIRVADADGSRHTVPTDVTLTITSGTGQWVYDGREVGTTITAPNYVYGVAAFNGYSYSKPGETVTVVASAASVNWQGSVINIAPVTFSFVTLAMNPKFACHSSAAPSFVTQNGGCHDTAHDLVWSYGLNNYTWHESIWDSLTTGQPANGHPYAVGATNDYDPAQNPAVVFPSNKDADVLAICHNLHANGYSDWRMPTFAEAVAARNSGLKDAMKDLNSTSGRYIWTSTTAAAANARVVLTSDLSGSGDSSSVKASSFVSHYTFCVRDPTP